MIRTVRLVLRPYQASDRDAFFALVRDPELMGRLSGALSHEASARLFARLLLNDPASGLIGWAATRERDYCGHVFLHNYVAAQGSAEIGFVVLKAFHGQGLAVEAASAVLEHARTVLGCHAINATVDDDNEPSKAVLARIGMTVVAREHDRAGEYLVYAAARPAAATKPAPP